MSKASEAKSVVKEEIKSLLKSFPNDNEEVLEAFIVACFEILLESHGKEKIKEILARQTISTH